MKWSKFKAFLKKKCAPAFLAFCMLFSVVPSFYQNTFFAVEDTFTLLDDAKENVSIYMNQTQLAYKSELKEKGNMTQLLKYYCRYLIALDYISNNVVETSNGKYDYIVGQREYQSYIQTLGAMSREINKIYNGAEEEGEADEKASVTSIKDKTVEFWLNDLSKTVPTELPTASKTSTVFREEVQHIFDDYIVNLLEVVSADALSLDSITNIDSELSDEGSLNKVINSNKNYVGPLSNLFSTMILSIDYWNSINTTNVIKNEYNNNTLQFSTNLDKLIKKALLEYKEESNSSNKIVIKDSNNILSLLTNTSRVDGELVVEGGGEANLTELGYIIVSAGSVYDPFVSKAGNDLFLESIHQFVSSEDQWNKTTTIIKKAISLKKPVWVAEVSSLKNEKSGKETATYRPAFITDMVSVGKDDNTKDALTQFGILKGYMQQSKVDSNTFEYVQNADPKKSGTEVQDSVTSGIVTVGSSTVLANNSEMSEPVAYILNDESYSKYKSGWSEMIGETTNIALENARMDTKSNNSLINANVGMLFVNGLGDIVLADDTIILPAIANPLLYEYTDNSFNLEQGSTAFGVNGKEYTFTKDFKGYYPYTATFMNHIPEVTKTGKNSDKLAFSNKKDKEKYVIVAEETALNTKMKNTAVQITAGSNDGGKVSVFRRNVVPIDINSFSVQEDETDEVSLFRLFELGQSFSIKGYLTNSLAKNKNNAYYVKDMKYNAEQVSFFPLIEDNNDLDSKVNISAPVVTSARRYIASVDAGNGEWSPTGNFKVDYFVRNYIAEALIGTQYAATMIKNLNVDYEDIVADTPRRFEIFLTGIVENIMNVFGGIDGVLSMRNAYENKFFALIIEFINLYYPFIAVLLLIIIATRFLRSRISVPYILVISLLTVAGFEIYTTWLPTYSTWSYNFFVNDIAEDISWNAIIHQSENYDETYANADRVNANGDPKPYTATITLYQLSNADVFRTCNRLNISETELKSGDIIYIDQNAGIFLQGNLIKMSLDKALSNKTIRGLYLNQWEALAAEENVKLEEIASTDLNKNPYQIRFVDSAPSLDSYYTPMNDIIQSFVDNLNLTTSIFKIQRNTFSYDKDFYKDAFVVNSFINSGLFLDPGNFEALRGNIVEGTIENGDYTVSSVKALVEAKFKYPEDWLGLSNILVNPSDDMKETLWLNTLKKNGYYEPDWKPTDKLNDLISYTNKHTKLFVMKNSDQLSFISDENAIKIISLYATTALCQRGSEYTSWMYPNYVNSGELELKDVLSASLTSMYDKIMAVDNSFVSTIGFLYGIVGLIAISLILFFSNLFILVITYLIPVLYASLGVLIVAKLVLGSNASATIKGYFKITFTTIVLYFIYNVSLTIANKLGHDWFSLLIVTLFSFICCYFMFFILLSLIQNFTELGNATLKANLLRASDLLTGGTISKLVARVTGNIQSNNTSTTAQRGIFNIFTRGSSIDDIPISRGSRELNRSDVESVRHYASPHRRREERGVDRD